ncbi:hypothetical protein HY065_00945 [Candidatus Berkelbacteria bacterium]|nr:hypothetical protein [Candidatus Berkelbacteria bacterium]
MKKLLFFLIILAAATGGVFYARHRIAGISLTIAPARSKKTSPIRFGGTFRYAAGTSKEAIDAQLALLEQLGIRTIRTIYYDCGNANWFTDDELLAAAKKHNIDVVFILEPRIDLKKAVKTSDLPIGATDCGSKTIGNQKGTGTVNLEQFGYDYAKEIVTKYKDQVTYWQLLNEIGGTAMTGNADGRDPAQFDKAIYGRLRAFLKGAAAGVRDGDPKAQRIINNQWLHVGMLDLIAQDKIPFEIIGWNWFVDKQDMQKVEYAPGQYFDLIAALKARKQTTGAKEIWLSEFDRDHGSYQQRGNDQATYLKTKLPQLIDTKTFSGIFIHELFDKPEEKLDQDKHWGIIEVATNPVLKLTPKPAAAAVSELIKKN